MVDHNDSLIREVDEEMRREQLQKLWEQYGTYMLGAAAAIVVGVAGYKWNEGRQLKSMQTAGASFAAASNRVTEGKADDALKAFETIGKSGPAGYAALAQLRTATLQMQAGKPDEALAAYEALGKSGGADSLIRDFARLQAAALRSGKADWTEMQNRLNELTMDKSPWRAEARELLGAAALKAGKVDEARKALEGLVADPRLPQAIAERARLLMGQVVAAEQALTKPPQPVGDDPAAAEPTAPASTEPAKPAQATGKAGKKK